MLIWERLLLHHISSGYLLENETRKSWWTPCWNITMSVDLMLISYYYQCAVRNYRTKTGTQYSKPQSESNKITTTHLDIFTYSSWKPNQILQVWDYRNSDILKSEIILELIIFPYLNAFAFAISNKQHMLYIKHRLKSLSGYI